MEFIISMQMLQEFDCPDVPLPPPLEGIDNAVFQTGTPPVADRPGSPAPPPPYSTIDKPPEYSTLPRDGQSTRQTQGESTSQVPSRVPRTRQPQGQGISQARIGGVAQGILHRHGNRHVEGSSEDCPAYIAPSLGSSWNTRTPSAGNDNSSHGNGSAPLDVVRVAVDDCNGYSDISSVSSPTRTGPVPR